MTVYDWKSLMTDWNGKIFKTVATDPNEYNDLTDYYEPDVLESKGLGYPPAGETQIQALENAIGKPLPPSYRQFLQFSNGWRNNFFDITGKEPTYFLRKGLC